MGWPAGLQSSCTLGDSTLHAVSRNEVGNNVRQMETYAWVCEVQLGRHAGVLAGLTCSKLL